MPQKSQCPTSAPAITFAYTGTSNNFLSQNSHIHTSSLYLLYYLLHKLYCYVLSNCDKLNLVSCTSFFCLEECIPPDASFGAGAPPSCCQVVVAPQAEYTSWVTLSWCSRPGPAVLPAVFQVCVTGPMKLEWQMNKIFMAGCGGAVRTAGGRDTLQLHSFISCHTHPQRSLACDEITRKMEYKMKGKKKLKWGHQLIQTSWRLLVCCQSFFY